MKLGDEMNGYDAEHNVRTAAEAAEWLDRNARELYPKSKYAASKDPVREEGNGDL